MKPNRVISRSVFAVVFCVITMMLSACNGLSGLVGGSAEAGSARKMSNSRLLNSLAIYEGITVAGEDVSNMARLVAVEKLKEKREGDLDSETIELFYGDLKYSYTLRQLGFYYDYDTATWAAFNKARTGEDAKRLEHIARLKEMPIDIVLGLKVNEEQLDSVIGTFSGDIHIDAKDGGYAFDKEKGKVYALDGEAGRDVNRDSIKAQMIKTAQNGGGKLEIPVAVVKVNPEYEKLAGRVKGVIGTATTYYNGDFWARVNNIEVSTDYLDGTVLAPGEYFSLNDCIGDTTYDKGYSEAIVLMGSKEVPGMGGGVCQTSTTLYQAALKADLEIVNRSPHSLKMPYDQGGLDAAIEYGLQDLAFVNVYDFPILIRGSYSYGEVTFEIWGDTDVKNYDIELVSEFEYGIGYSTTTKTNPELAPGTKKVVRWGVNGSVYSAYKVNQATGEYEYIGRSWYPAVNEEVEVGPDTKPANNE